jgi:hypothetical protein
MIDEQKLAWFEAQAEAAYDKMYDAANNTEAAAHYSDAKEALYDAISRARRLTRRADDPARGQARPYQGSVPIAVWLNAITRFPGRQRTIA